ncbi:protein neprosin [Corylus avellana]|uniref:protein neprosin n=1 Tax=Corylus avellana TaxID=13451 RepID=UPI00286CA6B5|nr:protein neprosin [Corylus avellana]
MGIVGRKRSAAGFSALLLLLPIFLITFLGRFQVVSGLSDTKYRQVSSLRLERIKGHLDKINKPAVLTIESPDGDTIDCVHKRKQPALDHPLLKNHKIQRHPSEMPKVKKDRVGDDDDDDDDKEAVRDAWQMWHRNGTTCPKGTVPIRRSTVGDVLRAKSLLHFGKKQPRLSLTTSNDPPYIGMNMHEHAVAYTRKSTRVVLGAKATINVWSPSVQLDTEFSLSQIWIASGYPSGFNLNTIEAGWQPQVELYGDCLTRLFIYWTADSYGATGCYNLLCAGFVQTNSMIAIGGAFSPSSYLGMQYELTIFIWKNWWIRIGDIDVGYWPAELFSCSRDHAAWAEWGGEVLNRRANGQHTFTQMGSGHFPYEKFQKASYFRNIEIVNVNNILSRAKDLKTKARNSRCYKIKISNNIPWGTYFYYGGPGNDFNVGLVILNRCPGS